jgi:putative cardiolipin synthase
MALRLREVHDGAMKEALLISPYFVPGPGGVRYFSAVEAKGVSIKVLTNALASTDELLPETARRTKS